jgi:hypothetical protein
LSASRKVAAVGTTLENQNLSIVYKDHPEFAVVISKDPARFRDLLMRQGMPNSTDKQLLQGERGSQPHLLSMTIGQIPPRIYCRVGNHFYAVRIYDIVVAMSSHLQKLFVLQEYRKKRCGSHV